MEWEAIAVILVLLVNVAVVAFSYGLTRQKLKDLCRRVEKIEKILNGKMT